MGELAGEVYGGGGGREREGGVMICVKDNSEQNRRKEGTKRGRRAGTGRNGMGRVGASPSRLPCASSLSRIGPSD